MLAIALIRLAGTIEETERFCRIDT